MASLDDIDGKQNGRVQVELTGDTGTGVSRVYVGAEADTLSNEDLLRGWYLDPSEWQIVGPLRVNRWLQNASEGTWCYQYRANVERVPVALEDVPPVVKVQVRVKRDTKRRLETDLSCAVIYPDAQISYWRDDSEKWRTSHDEAALDISRQITADVEAQHGINALVDLGDFLDATHFSKHRTQPAFLDRHAFRRAVARGQQELAARAQLAPNAARYLIPGNHEQRITNWLIENAAWLLGLSIGDADPILSLNWLLDLDGHGWTLADGYPEGVVWLNPNLRCIHGHIAKGRPGHTAGEYLAEEVSTIAGHHPRTQTAYRTTARHGQTRTYVAHLPSGLMRVDGAVPSAGSSTTPAGDPVLGKGEKWEQGVSVVFYDSEGHTVPYIEHIPVFGGRAIWRGKLYSSDLTPDGDVLPGR